MHVFSAISLFGQDEENGDERYSWFDNVIGQTNSGIFKGVLFVNEFRVVNEKHQFFGSTDFREGSVTYNNQSYFNISLNYDVYLDNLLVQNSSLANRPVMTFDKEGVDRFTINDHHFKYVIGNKSDNVSSGFFEILLEKDSLVLYKKHTKKIFRRTDEQIIYYEFKDGYYYLLYSNGTYHPFKKSKELNRIFPESKKELITIRKKHNQSKKTGGDNHIKAILSDLLQLQPTLKQKGL